jgi:hypothetical protein
MKRPETPTKLFTQVIEAARPAILKLWEQGDLFFPKDGTQCSDEIQHEKNIGRSYYQCNPHFWQCFWMSGVKENPFLKVELYGQKFRLRAKNNFKSIPAFSKSPRYYDLFKRESAGIDLNYGYIVEIEVQEIPGLTQTMILSDSCRDTFLPERIYGHLKEKDANDNGFLWDNFNRNIFIDRFYVTNRQINEWRILTGHEDKVEKNRKNWPKPSFISLSEQKSYCEFYGKRLLEAKLFDAASMSPSDLKNPLPEKIYRPDTPWQRDMNKSFLGMARINPDYQLTPLDCQLAQVQGCAEKYFTTDSATWMGFHFSLGFFSESLNNFINPKNNIKLSSRFYSPASSWHELGLFSEWSGIQSESLPVAFRCYEEVSQ